MSFVLDASATAVWCFPDEDRAAADAAFDRLAVESAVVPSLWWVEIRNVLIIGERRGRIEPAETIRFLSDLDRLPIETDRNPVSDLVLALARRHKLTAYDAVYLELASRIRSPLATLDVRLAGAARASGIEVIA